MPWSGHWPGGRSRAGPTAEPGPGSCATGSLTHSRVCAILSNPVYAGAYVYGRFRSRRTVSPDGSIRTSTVELPRTEWAVCLRDHHPGYITWEAFEANEAKLAANRLIRVSACGHACQVIRSRPLTPVSLRPSDLL